MQPWSSSASCHRCSSTGSSPAGHGGADPCAGPEPAELADGSLVVSMTAPGPGVVVVRAVGEIDLLTAPAWRRMLTSGAQLLVSAPPEPRAEASVDAADPLVLRLVCDLSPVTFLGTTGLTVLVELADQCTRTGVDLRVVAGNRRVSRLLAHTALDRHLTTTSRLDQAVVVGRSSSGTSS